MKNKQCVIWQTVSTCSLANKSNNEKYTMHPPCQPFWRNARLLHLLEKKKRVTTGGNHYILFALNNKINKSN